MADRAVRQAEFVGGGGEAVAAFGRFERAQRGEIQADSFGHGEPGASWGMVGVRAVPRKSRSARIDCCMMASMLGSRLGHGKFILLMA
ncbi:hypothetical protein [Burkholderia gladioli]|uniref:hypothetical protein n=1 Tax=Burkholderia gladioli TaxID=28095 RepID=UPI0015E34A84|nr:hypothetical protein [Burkholderia gladioli]MBU9269876.1 hypothetical protein [Burkholderia gladioli]